MEFIHKVVWLFLLSAAALVCFVTAISWFRETYRMFKAGEARPLLLPFPIFIYMDFINIFRRRIQDRLPPEFQSRMERARFESIITYNYLKAVMVLLFGIIAGSMVYSMAR
jgi:hypothetical protein